MGNISLKGYHGTCSYAKKSIENRGLDPDATNPRSDHWLGRGVYLFEDIIQAQWWAIDVSSKKHGSFPVIYGVHVTAEENQVLNLDNNNELASFLVFIKENIETINAICKEENKGFPIVNEQQFKGVFFDYYKKTFGIKVIIRTFTKDFVKYVPNYPTDSPERKQQKNLLKTLNLSFGEKQICVSDKKCITDCRVVYEGKETDAI